MNNSINESINTPQVVKIRPGINNTIGDVFFYHPLELEDNRKYFAKITSKGKKFQISFRKDNVKKSQDGLIIEIITPQHKEMEKIFSDIEFNQEGEMTIH